jgi:hypothetical protein
MKIFGWRFGEGTQEKKPRAQESPDMETLSANAWKFCKLTGKTIELRDLTGKLHCSDAESCMGKWYPDLMANIDPEQLKSKKIDSDPEKEKLWRLFVTKHLLSECDPKELNLKTICKYSLEGVSATERSKDIELTDYTVESESKQKGKCDRCSSSVTKGEGYLVYSDAQSMGIVTGAMMICENCADAFFRKEIWDKATHAVIEVDASDESALKKAYVQANDISVIMRTKRRGLNHDQARAEAREIAEFWWGNQQEAIQRLLSQSPSKR